MTSESRSRLIVARRPRRKRSADKATKAIDNGRSLEQIMIDLYNKSTDELLDLLPKPTYKCSLTPSKRNPPTIRTTTSMRRPLMSSAMAGRQIIC